MKVRERFNNRVGKVAITYDGTVYELVILEGLEKGNKCEHCDLDGMCSGLYFSCNIQAVDNFAKIAHKDGCNTVLKRRS